MPARLTIHPPYRAAQVFTLLDGREYVIGRDAGCEPRLDDARLSCRHARLVGDGAGWQLVDLASENGTAVDGAPIAVTHLGGDAWLSLGGLPARFELTTEAARDAEVAANLVRWRQSAAARRRLRPELGVDGLLQRLLAAVVELSGAERSLVLLADEDEEELSIAATLHLDPPDLLDPGFGWSVEAVQRALESGEPVAVSDLQSVPQPEAAGHTVRALACLPLRAGDQLLGLLYADSRSPGASFTELDLDILEAIGSHGAIALHVALLEAELNELTATLEAGTGWLAAARPMDMRPGETAWSAVLAAHREQHRA